MLYCYILGCGIACLIFTGISSMDTVDVKPVEIVLNTHSEIARLVRHLVRASSKPMRMHTVR